MARTVSIGRQDFEKIRVNDNFYVDKTYFIRQWWESQDDVTLITRPRRFGKTLNMSMLEQFFSIKYAGRGDLFEGLSIWQEEKYRLLQGTYPVIALSFAKVKETSYPNVRKRICRILSDLYMQYDFLEGSEKLNAREKELYRAVCTDMDDSVAAESLNTLSGLLMKHYGKRVIILLDEYDTPLQEAYMEGYWDEMASFIRNIFNAAFKTNPYLERAIMTGITRISRESIFSDLNNLEAVTTTSEKYADCFGFTEDEVLDALKEFDLSDRQAQVRDWYDGFTFGGKKDIYNPWSIIHFLDKKSVGAYWANSSSNKLVSQLIQRGSANNKKDFEKLLTGGTLEMEIDEQIVYNQLYTKKNALWSLLLASGYLKVTDTAFMERTGRRFYHLALTDKEVRIMFEDMIRDWFSWSDNYSDFIKALLLGDIKAMNTYMNKMTLEMFSYFDTGKNPQGEPERFYHGFVLGLVAELADRYLITSNRESGFGRYDVMMEPRTGPGEVPGTVGEDCIIMEFKVQEDEETELAETVSRALQQIEEKDYQASLIAKGVPQSRIRKYGFGFCGKKVLIGKP